MGMTIGQRYVVEHGSRAAAAEAFARDLMRGSPSTHVAGYTPANAAIGAAEVFYLNREELARLCLAVDAEWEVVSGECEELLTKRDNEPKPPSVGERYRLSREVDRYPHFVAPQGAEGTVVEGTEGCIALRMDTQIDGCAEWDNCIVWTVDEDCPENPPDNYFPLAARVFREDAELIVERTGDAT